MIDTFKTIIARDVKLDIRRAGQIILLPSFFILITLLYPLGLGTDPDILQSAGPGLLIIAALMASLLPFDRLYTEDFKDGTLDFIVMSKTPLGVYVSGKIIAHWMMAGIPLVLLSPVLAGALDLNIHWATLALCFIPITLLFTLIGQLAAALSLNTKRGGTLLAILIIPLTIPVMIFGAGALNLAQVGSSPDAPLLFLWAALSIAAPLAPIISTKLIRMQMN